MKRIGDGAFKYSSSLTSVYYKGNASEWTQISGNTSLENVTRYYYSESEPTTSGNYWHYDENGDIVVVETYTVIWSNWNGTVLELDENINRGTMPTYDGQTPSKDSDMRGDYTFSGWSPTVDAVTGNVTYVAQFSTELKKYTVTWKNWDGTILETDVDVTYGTTPTYNRSNPTKAADAQYSYTFYGWSPSVSAVAGDVTYTAIFANERNSFTVTWKNWDGTILEVDKNVPRGSIPTYNGNDPTKDGDANAFYKWEGKWSSALEPVSSDMTFTAVFVAIQGTEINASNWRDYLYIRYGYSSVRSEYDSRYYDHIIVSGKAENINSNYEYMDITVTVSVTVQFYEIYDGGKGYRTKTEEFTFTVNETGNGSFSFNVYDVYGMASGVNTFSMTLVSISGYAIKK